ncbi:MAG: hypothetical protein ACKO8G_04470 [Actinomycetota bacterium]
MPTVPTASTTYSCVSATPTKGQGNTFNSWFKYTWNWEVDPGDCFNPSNTPCTGIPVSVKTLTYDASAGTTTYLVSGPTVEASVTIERLTCSKWDNSANTCSTTKAAAGFTTTTVRTSLSLGSSTLTIQTLA